MLPTRYNSPSFVLQMQTVWWGTQGLTDEAVAERFGVLKIVQA
jgi:hypothetical protein